MTSWDIQSAAAAAHSKTWRIFGPRNQRASVLECGGAPPLSTDERIWNPRFMESMKSDSAVPVVGALSKPHFRQFVLQLCLERLEVARRRFVAFFCRRKTETPELVEIPRGGVAVAERHTAAGHCAGPRNLVHLHFHISSTGFGQFALRQ